MESLPLPPLPLPLLGFRHFCECGASIVSCERCACPVHLESDRLPEILVALEDPNTSFVCDPCVEQLRKQGPRYLN